jgi:hypothetical protein
MKTLIGAGIALVALAGPGLVQAQTLVTGVSTAGPVAVTTTVAPACAIQGTTSNIAVTVGLNGGAVTGAAPNAGGLVTITCNTPEGVVAIGSDDMKNTTGAPIVETDIFTDTIKFVGGARPVAPSATTTGWVLASRGINSWNAWQSAKISANTTNLRQMRLGISAFDFEALSKIPTAGSYVGKVCVTVNPSGTPLNGRGNGFCNGAPVVPVPDPVGP